jgi:hypothetical protein
MAERVWANKRLKQQFIEGIAAYLLTGAQKQAGFSLS